MRRIRKQNVCVCGGVMHRTAIRPGRAHYRWQCDECHTTSKRFPISVHPPPQRPTPPSVLLLRSPIAVVYTQEGV